MILLITIIRYYGIGKMFRRWAFFVHMHIAMISWSHFSLLSVSWCISFVSLCIAWRRRPADHTTVCVGERDQVSDQPLRRGQSWVWGGSLHDVLLERGGGRWHANGRVRHHHEDLYARTRQVLGGMLPWSAQVLTPHFCLTNFRFGLLFQIFRGTIYGFCLEDG